MENVEFLTRSMEWNLDGLANGLLIKTNGRPSLQQSQIEWLADGDSPLTRWAPTKQCSALGATSAWSTKGVERCAPVSPSQEAHDRVSPLLCSLSTPLFRAYKSCAPLCQPIKASQSHGLDYNSPPEDSDPWGRHSPTAL